MPRLMLMTVFDPAIDADQSDYNGYLENCDPEKLAVREGCNAWLFEASYPTVQESTRYKYLMMGLFTLREDGSPSIKPGREGDYVDFCYDVFRRHIKAIRNFDQWTEKALTGMQGSTKISRSWMIEATSLPGDAVVDISQQIHKLGVLDKESRKN